MKVGLLGKGLNTGRWLPLERTLAVQGLDYEFLGHHMDIREAHGAVLSLGYDRLIPGEILEKPAFGVIVFHSSDLPRGRGWAPLFHTIIQRAPRLTQTMFYAAPEIDAGPMIAKARYPIDAGMGIADLRKIDDQLTCLLFERYAPLVCRQRIAASRQRHDRATVHPKRVPEESRIDPSLPLTELYDLLRALPDHLPAFFDHDGHRVEVRLSIEGEVEFDPRKAVIEDLSANAGSSS